MSDTFTTLQWIAAIATVLSIMRADAVWGGTHPRTVMILIGLVAFIYLLLTR